MTMRGGGPEADRARICGGAGREPDAFDALMHGWRRGRLPLDAHVMARALAVLEGLPVAPGTPERWGVGCGGYAPERGLWRPVPYRVTSGWGQVCRLYGLDVVCPDTARPVPVLGRAGVRHGELSHAIGLLGGLLEAAHARGTTLAGRHGA